MSMFDVLPLSVFAVLLLATGVASEPENQFRNPHGITCLWFVANQTEHFVVNGQNTTCTCQNNGSGYFSYEWDCTPVTAPTTATPLGTVTSALYIPTIASQTISTTTAVPATIFPFPGLPG